MLSLLVLAWPQFAHHSVPTVSLTLAGTSVRCVTAAVVVSGRLLSNGWGFDRFGRRRSVLSRSAGCGVLGTEVLPGRNAAELTLNNWRRCALSVRVRGWDWTRASSQRSSYTPPLTLMGCAFGGTSVLVAGPMPTGLALATTGPFEPEALLLANATLAGIRLWAGSKPSVQGWQKSSPQVLQVYFGSVAPMIARQNGLPALQESIFFPWATALSVETL
jgi:hypothetical protein